MHGDECDALVVGARVAGSTLAALLGDAGYRVILVDRATFPSSTLSTHFFRGAQAVSVMQDLDVLEDVLALGSPKLTCQYFYADGVETGELQPPQDPGAIGYALSVRRESLDNLLVRRASRAATVELLERSRLTGLIREGDSIVGARVATPKGERVIRSHIVVGADGRHSAVAREVGPDVEQMTPAFRGMFYCYVREFQSPHGGQLDGPEFSMFDGEIVGIFPSDDGVTCAALSVGLDDFRSIRKDVETEFWKHVDSHLGVAERLRSAKRVGRMLGCGPEPNWVRVPVGDGWALVGDAGLHQDPWSGRGIDMAMKHATFLAEELIGNWQGKLSKKDALDNYRQRRDEHALDLYRETISFI